MLVPGELYLNQIDDIFTKDECADLLNRANQEGWHNPETGGSYMRSIIIDRELADKLYVKLKEHIPDTYMGYKLLYINDHFRFSRYNTGGVFPIHQDGTNYDSSKVDEYDGYSTESVFTLNIFLNDDFEGGETDFFEPNPENPDELKLRFSVVPKCGRGSLFYAKQYHRGNKVTVPYKYLIRTDVMGMRE